jgi:ferritin-like metal-binding protein YciE
MGLFTKDIKSMDDLYLHVLQDIYYAENQIKKALPDMIEKATNRDLSAAFKAHLGETENQIGHLEQAFKLLGKEPKGTTCPAIDGIIKEANEVAGECDNKKVLDAALIAAAQEPLTHERTNLCDAARQHAAVCCGVLSLCCRLLRMSRCGTKKV